MDHEERLELRAVQEQLVLLVHKVGMDVLELQVGMAGQVPPVLLDQLDRLGQLDHKELLAEADGLVPLASQDLRVVRETGDLQEGQGPLA